MSAQTQKQPAGWTCLGGPQLLLGRREGPLRPARRAVGLGPHNLQGCFNLRMAMLETGAKGMREQVVAELRESANGSLRPRPCWGAAEKIQAWLEL